MFFVRLLLLPACAHAFYRFHDLYMRQETIFDKTTFRAGESRDTFSQILDHDNPSATTWQQRYYVNERYYKKGGPVFLVLGGEWQESATSLWGFYSKDIAIKYGALVAALEHRFYGHSVPTPDLSTKNLRYLSSRQALADAANFISAIKDNILGLKTQVAADAKVIVIGGSYAGNLAAWLRLKFPSVVHGAVASSGPVLAKYNFKEYLEVVSASLASHKKECVDDIQKATDAIYEALKDPAKTEALTERLHLCHPIDPSNKKDVSLMFLELAGLFMGAVQNDKGSGIKTVCEAFLRNKTMRSALDRLGDLVRSDDPSPSDSCVNAKYANRVKMLRVTAKTVQGWTPVERQWLYQKCTEFGYYKTTDSPNQPFGHSIPVRFHSESCADIYGPEFNVSSAQHAVERTNAYYGGLNLTKSNIAFFNGDVDPWHALGITVSKVPGQIAVLAKGASHCADMFMSRSEPRSVNAARKKIDKFIGAMLKQ